MEEDGSAYRHACLRASALPTLEECLASSLLFSEMPFSHSGRTLLLSFRRLHPSTYRGTAPQRACGETQVPSLSHHGGSLEAPDVSALAVEKVDSREYLTIGPFSLYFGMLLADRFL